MSRVVELFKKIMVKSASYDAVYNILGPLINRPFSERSVNVMHDRQLIFVHNPKCAGTSIKRKLGVPPGIVADHRIPSYMVHKKTWESYFSFVVVRNPFERLVSSYTYHTSSNYKGFFVQRYPHLQELGLEDYFDLMRKEPTGIRPQVDYTQHARSKVPVNKICRMERLVDDLRDLFDKVGIAADLPHENRSVHRGYRDYFMDDRFMERVSKFYQADLKRFGYKF